MKYLILFLTIYLDGCIVSNYAIIKNSTNEKVAIYIEKRNHHSPYESKYSNICLLSPQDKFHFEYDSRNPELLIVSYFNNNVIPIGFSGHQKMPILLYNIYKNDEYGMFYKLEYYDEFKGDEIKIQRIKLFSSNNPNFDNLDIVEKCK